MSNIIDWSVTSFGLKRRLAALFQMLSGIVVVIPGLSLLSPIFQSIASWFGVVGTLHATAAGTLGVNPLTTLAAIVSAIDLVFKAVPFLQPYEYYVHAVATFLSILAAGSVIGGGNG